MPGLDVDDALVDVHRAARLAFHRLGHEGGEDAVAQRGLAHRALEQEHAVGQVHRVAVREVDLHLPGAGLVDQRLHAEAVHAAELREFHEEGIEVVDRVDGVRLPARLGLAGPPERRLQRLVRILLASDQVELHLGGDHCPPALGRVQRHHAAQHAARRELHRRAVELVAVVDHDGHGLGRPGHQAHGAGVGQAHHVGVGRADVRAVVGLLAVDGVEQHALGDAHLAGGQEQVFGQDLAARDARHVGDHALHLVDAVPGQEFVQGIGHGMRAIGGAPPWM